MRESRIMPKMDASDSTLRFFGPHAFHEEPQLVFASKLERHAGPGKSVLEYPVGPPKEEGGPRTPVHIPLGGALINHGNGVKEIKFRVEYTYPAGTADCPNKAIGYYKANDTGGGNT